MDSVEGYTNPVPIGNGYFVSGCDTCGAAVFIDERHHGGDGRQTHSEWHGQVGTAVGEYLDTFKQMAEDMARR